MKLAFIIAGLIILACVPIIAGYLRLRYYTTRNCHGRSWREAFPSASKDSIRKFLDVFCDSFLFSKKHRLNFSPDDKLGDIYKKIYPLSFADSLEFETFFLRLSEEFGCDELDGIQFDSTLGEVFHRIQK
jgi:propanediol dehydratase small subunit